MKRRDFLKSALVTGAALSLPAGLDPVLNVLQAAERPDLAVARGTPPAAIVRAAIGSLGGMKRFVSRGDIVVVKPNIGWDRTPEYRQPEPRSRRRRRPALLRGRRQAGQGFRSSRQRPAEDLHAERHRRCGIRRWRDRLLHGQPEIQGYAA